MSRCGRLTAPFNVDRTRRPLRSPEGEELGIQLLHRWDPESYAKFCSGLAIPHHSAVSLCPDGQEGEMAESSAKQDRADRKLAKYISRRSLAIGIALLAVVFVTAIIHGAG